MYSRGNGVFYYDHLQEAFYEDGTPFDDTRPCTKCGVACGTDDPDPCLGWLDGVDYACCGHGIQGEEYVVANGKAYESVEAWRLETGRATLSDTTHQQEV